MLIFRHFSTESFKIFIKLKIVIFSLNLYFYVQRPSQKEYDKQSYYACTIMHDK